jgi:SpoIID/LytB domain protein
MRKPLLILLFMCALLSAAEFRDGVLYLEVNLASGSTIELREGSFRFCDESELFCENLEGNLKISVVGGANESRFGFLEHTAESETEEESDEDAITRDYFAWEAGHLVIKQQRQYFHPRSFETIARAREFAKAIGISENSIQEIPIVNSSLNILDAESEVHYFESPLKIVAEELWIGELCFEGEFILKVIDGKVVLNQILPLEEYIAGVVPNEIGNYSPMEALKAQAVAARSHAVNLLLYNRHAKDGFDLCSSTHCQVYKGKHLRNTAIEEAVSETAAEIMVTEDRVADSTYHSSCGGKTDSSQAIWNGAYIPHLSGSLCIPEAANYDLSFESGAARWINTPVDTSNMSSWERSTLNWEKTIRSSDLASHLGLKSIKSIRIIKRGESGRILSLLINESFALDGEYRIRQAFGMLPSSFFYFSKHAGKNLIYPGKTITVKGRGSGHGVGMCQVGALRKAREGAAYRDILQTYYPNTKLSTQWILYDQP